MVKNTFWATFFALKTFSTYLSNHHFLANFFQVYGAVIFYVFFKCSFGGAVTALPIGHWNTLLNEQRLDPDVCMYV